MSEVPKILKWQMDRANWKHHFPAGPVLHVGEQDGLVTIWNVSTEKAREFDAFAYVGTGDEPPPDCTHIGTVQMKSGSVWHVYRLNYDSITKEVEA